jgi:CubicO group peptidase (beta-lactamase class C family)
MDAALLGELIAAAGYPPGGAGGIAVAVRVPEGTLEAAAGQALPGIPFDAGTVSYCGSTAKQVTAACAAGLVIAGRLDVQAPVSRWLPELPQWASRVRVQYLIHHTGGLPGPRGVLGLGGRAR